MVEGAAQRSYRLLDTELPVGKTSALTHLDKAKAVRDSLATREFKPEDMELRATHSNDRYSGDSNFH